MAGDEHGLVLGREPADERALGKAAVAHEDRLGASGEGKDVEPAFVIGKVERARERLPDGPDAQAGDPAHRAEEDRRHQVARAE